MVYSWEETELLKWKFCVSKMEILGAVFMVTSHIIRNFALSTDGTASAVKRA